MKFKQSDWSKKCINFNTDKGSNTNLQNSFEKDFFKLMNHSVYSKAIIQHLRKRVKVRLINKAIDKKSKKRTNMQEKQVLVHRQNLANILLLFLKLNQF